MIQLHPEFITKNGNKEFAVLPYEEFVKIQGLLEDLEDLQDLRKAKQEENSSPSIPLSEVKKMLNLSQFLPNQRCDRLY
ncbi:type II toxin-antitoxin system Phd/YefM family antitoxin [Cyanobacterium stanieri LEGE 03274]|uniref:Type II toxin-antitoxin system Phd/YefM family antitoxin n=1 Tax=Cyanobacterium stanieri LEGE 03274 TaxID=1828756 RepID=A0ABR9V789_9CHRO|nr:type II toxin-antitoxin system Phd/YefM family antitoxin [Cyanobacterium stanieri]MBE9223760.1 type II toxin-antitoxin system Phd/YefM family antitoxin [Cyanobacterium stanieri LEGE 03274]